MNLQDQYNKTKEELSKLFDMMQAKAVGMTLTDAPRNEIRRVIRNANEIKLVLENGFNMHEIHGANQIEIACQIGDKY